MVAGLMEEADKVETRAELVAFLASLAQRVRTRTVEIEHRASSELLEGASGWVEDMDGFFANWGTAAPSEPTWRLIAMIFAASLIYE